MAILAFQKPDKVIMQEDNVPVRMPVPVKVNVKRLPVRKK